MSMYDQGKASTAIDESNYFPKNKATLQGTSKLRRMPHVFCKLIDLPFAADTHVVIEERRECYVFMVQKAGLQEEDVVVEVVQIVPGALKVMLRGADRIRAAAAAGSPKSPYTGEMENWRARLPACTIPEAAKAMYAQGILSIIIPKLLPSPSQPHRSQDTKLSLLCSNA